MLLSGFSIPLFRHISRVPHRSWCWHIVKKDRRSSSHHWPGSSLLPPKPGDRLVEPHGLDIGAQGEPLFAGVGDAGMVRFQIGAREVKTLLDRRRETALDLDVPSTIARLC